MIFALHFVSSRRCATLDWRRSSDTKTETTTIFGFPKSFEGSDRHRHSKRCRRPFVRPLRRRLAYGLSDFRSAGRRSPVAGYIRFRCGDVAAALVRRARKRSGSQRRAHTAASALLFLSLSNSVTVCALFLSLSLSSQLATKTTIEFFPLRVSSDKRPKGHFRLHPNFPRTVTFPFPRKG